jgi:uncharacterized protein
MYHVFPYKRTKLSRTLLISRTGEYVFCDDHKADTFASGASLSEDFYIELKTKHFLCGEDEVSDEELIYAIRRQTKRGYLDSSSILLMVVPTIECNCECIYCQASSKKRHNRAHFMSFKESYDFCAFALALPHAEIKIEFQGGEPTLHVAAIQFIVLFLEKHKKACGKAISYVICTNLLTIDTSLIDFIARHHIDVSTSLDGDKELHDLNRPSRLFESTHDRFKENLLRLRTRGIYPSALLTITRNNIGHIERIIDEYETLGFRSIFIRQLNNYGRAFRNSAIEYSDDDFMRFYAAGVKYVIRQNLEFGIPIREEGLAILLKKVESPFLDGFVDMQNPTALARMCLLVNYEGSIYPSDEARMIAEMGDKRFLLGRLDERIPYAEMIKRSPDFSRLHSLDEVAECRECSYAQFCGADPVRKYYTSNISGKQFCGKKRKMFDFLFSLLEGASPAERKLFTSWAND